MLLRHIIDYITDVYSICPTVRVMSFKVIWQENLWLRKRCYKKIEMEARFQVNLWRLFGMVFPFTKLRQVKFLLKIMTRWVAFYTYLILRGTVQIIAIHISSDLEGSTFSLRVTYVSFALFTQDGFKEERNIFPQGWIQVLWGLKIIQFQGPSLRKSIQT